MKHNKLTFEKITENHLVNLGIGNGKIKISVELDGNVGYSEIDISAMRDLQVYHGRSSIGETLISMVENATILTDK